VRAVTRWFNVVDDGNPQLPGWYDVLYSFEPKDIDRPSRYWWDGQRWRVYENSPVDSSFGNSYPVDDHWRGLAEDPNA